MNTIADGKEKTFKEFYKFYPNLISNPILYHHFYKKYLARVESVPKLILARFRNFLPISKSEAQAVEIIKSNNVDSYYSLLYYILR